MLLLQRTKKKLQRRKQKDRKHLWKDSWIPLLRQMPQKRRLRILPQERQLSKLLPLKKIAGPEGTGAEDYANLDSVDISKLGEIGKKAYLVSQYEKEHGHTRGGKK